MKKELLLKSFALGVVLLILVSLTSVVGYNSIKSTSVTDNNPLFSIRKQKAINKDDSIILTSEYLGKGSESTTTEIESTSKKIDSDISLITLKVEGVIGGDNWYGSDNSFTFTYESNEVKEIYYGIDGNWFLYTGPFNVDEGGNHTLEWYAVDYSGNQSEIDGPFYFKVDKTKPEVLLEFEVTGGSHWYGFELTFTASAVDSMIGMDRVEFYLGNILQKIDKGPGPIYKWVLPNYNPVIKIIIYAIAFDKAGNSAMDSIEPILPWGFKNYFNKIFSSGIVEIKNAKVAEKSSCVVSESSDFDPASAIVVFNREFGKNNWINSNASISIFYEIDRIDKVYYQLNNGSWILYTDPIIISEDGMYNFSWYVIDSEGHTSTSESIFFKIDKTPPEINLKTEKVSKNEVKVIAEVDDATSGIDMVNFQNRFFFDFTDYEYPYEWVLTRYFSDIVTAVVYDMAGNSASSAISTPKSLSIQQFTSSKQINKLFQNLILNHQIRIFVLRE